MSNSTVGRLISVITSGSSNSSSLKCSKWSFVTFGGSAFLVLNVFTGEWIDFLFTCMEISEKSQLCPLIFISMYVVGHLVIVSLFTALLLSSFSESLQFNKKESRLGYYYKHVRSFVRLLLFKVGSCIQEILKAVKLNQLLESMRKTRCYIKFKQFALSNTFEGIVIFLVICSCIVMIIDHADVNEKDTPVEFEIVKVSSIILAVFFTLEMILRWVGVGIKSYFSDPWMVLDFIILVIFIVEIVLEYGFNLGQSVTFLQASRALRPLRFVNKVKGMETIVGAFVLTLPAILRVIVICLFFWLPFAILGIHFFAGNFFRCINDRGHVFDHTEVENKSDCLAKNHTWMNSFQNFDDIGNSYMTLLQMALFGNWADLAQLIVDFRGHDLQPKASAYTERQIFVITFLLVGGFFSLNLFIGVTVDTFQTMIKQVEGGLTEMSLSKSQKTYYRALRKIGRRKFMTFIVPPTNKFLNICFKMCNSWWFNIITFFMIIANTIVIAVFSYKMSPSDLKILHYIEYSFLPAYLLEFLIKIFAFGKHYFKDFFNVQDLCTLILFMIGEVIHAVFNTETNILAFLYAFRIIQIFHLLHLTEIFISLRLLIYATIASFSSLLNIILLLFIIHFIYAIIGMSMFNRVKFGRYINLKTNFKNVPNSLLLLFRLATSEGWEKIYEGLGASTPFCKENCGNKTEAAIFLVSFIFFTNILLVNIFIAVILDNYNDAIAEEQDIFKEENLILFHTTWREFDRMGTQFIPIEKLPIFLDELSRDLRIPKPNTVAISYMELPVTVSNKVHSLDVLQGILKVKLGKVEDSEIFRVLQSQMQLRYERMFPELKGSRFIGTTMDLKRREFAARTIQKNYKKLKENKLTKMEREKRKLPKDFYSFSKRRLSVAPSQRLSLIASRHLSTLDNHVRFRR